MNISLNSKDYSNSEQFQNVLEGALSKKGRTLRKKVALGLENEKNYKDTLYHYLYWRLLETFDDSYIAPETYEITVTETGGNGAYYVYDGYKRKADNTVTIKVYPPDEMFVSGVTVNSSKVYYRIGNDFTFTMPDTNANLVISYSEIFTLMIIYFGSSDITTIYNPENGNQVIYSDEGITIPFNNTSPEYIWFASPIQMSIVEAFGHQADISETFDVQTIFIRGLTYYLYVHKWKTQVNNLTFYN